MYSTIASLCVYKNNVRIDCMLDYKFDLKVNFPFIRNSDNSSKFHVQNFF